MKIRKFPKIKRQKERGRFLFKEQWYSICSMHFAHNETCTLCNTGHWRNVFVGKITSFVYKVAPSVWRFWANFSFKKKLGMRFDRFDDLP